MGLWDASINLCQTKQNTNDVLNKIKKFEDSPSSEKHNDDVVSVLKKKSTSVEEALTLIKSEVIRILGRYNDSTIVIKTRSELHDYITKAIENEFIAIDTETNNSLDSISCLLMGACIYTPNDKQAYIPINHVNYITNERLPWQLTEKDINEEFQRLLDNNVKIIMHNGKFDYEVIKSTCGLALTCYWDTMLCAKILDENEHSAGLKQQYIDKIDSSQEKYSIEHLFYNIQYAVVPPEIFALYAATDAYITFKLFEWQNKQMHLDKNKDMLNLLLNIEMPCMIVAAEMELTGVELDEEYTKRLSLKYNTKNKEINQQIENELTNYKEKIDSWRLTPDALNKPLKKGKSGNVTINGKKYLYTTDDKQLYYWIDLSSNKKLTYKEAEMLGLFSLISQNLGKSKSEQLTTPINIASPTQLAILLYDVLKTPVIDKKSPRGTGEDILKEINLPICQLILEQRGLEKLLNTYIDNLPLMINKKTGRIHCQFNQYGAATGRFSSSNPNLQNIPSHNKEIRLMFQARTDDNHFIDNSPGYYEMSVDEQLYTKDGLKNANELHVGDIIQDDVVITNLDINEKSVKIYTNGECKLKVHTPYVLVGSDFSQQEPRLLSIYSGDKNMQQAYKDGKDLYATIASGVYHNDYWDNMEHHQDGSANPEGKKRRSNCKSLLLGRPSV